MYQDALNIGIERVKAAGRSKDGEQFEGRLVRIREGWAPTLRNTLFRVSIINGQQPHSWNNPAHTIIKFRRFTAASLERHGQEDVTMQVRVWSRSSFQGSCGGKQMAKKLFAN
jgi:hypothetical protein